MASEKKTLRVEANVSAKRNLISAGGCADTPVDIDAARNADGKRPCLGDGQTVLMRTPTQVQFVECWSESIIRNGRPRIFLKAPGGKDLSRMEAQYEMFVEAVGSKKVTV
jgi:hypothetical protein